MKKLYHKEYIGFLYYMIVCLLITSNFPRLLENGSIRTPLVAFLIVLMIMYGKNQALDSWPI